MPFFFFLVGTHDFVLITVDRSVGMNNHPYLQEGHCHNAATLNLRLNGLGSNLHSPLKINKNTITCQRENCQLCIKYQ